MDDNAEIAYKVAVKIRMTPTAATRLFNGKTGWWLTGCVEGDQPLPNTEGCSNETEAFDALESWFSDK
jgi:hypothetical protein